MPQYVIIIIALFFNCSMAQINFSSKPCSSRQGKIVGGQEADKNEMPFIVSLTRRGGHFCGASIIHDRWLLTAGHCVCNGLNNFLKPDQIQGVMGLHSIKEFLGNNVQTSNKNHIPLQVNFKDIVPHPKYQCTKVQNDIALLEVLQPITFSTYIQPTCLAFEGGISILDHDIATVSGWGWTQENQEDGERADILRKAAVQIWNNKNCEKSYRANGKANNFISDTQMCAGLQKGGVDSCWADSGGPLVSRDNVLIGVVSTGIGCARPGLPGIYTRVSKYIQWIESVIV